MRKVIPILLLCLLLCLLLAGCGRSAPTPTEAPTAEPTEAPAPTGAGFDFGFSDGEAEALSFEEAAAKARSDPEAVVLFATNVGKGDALILRVGDWVGLIDTGKTRARGRVERALALMGADSLDAVFITHTDDDHTGGLAWLPGQAASAWYASALYTGVKADKHPLVKAVGDRVRWLGRGDEIALPNGAALKVLAPNSLYTDKDDNNSLVMLLESPQGKILLTGDMELPEEAELLTLGDDLSCAVLKVPNHGDDDTTSAAFANACAAQIAVVSTDGAEKPGTPDAGVVRRLEAAGSRVVVTEDSGLGFLVTLKGGEAAVNPVDFGAPMIVGLSIAAVDASDDTITLQNTGSAAVSLSGCYLYSDKGDELYVFADESIGPGASLTIGTRSTKGDYDLLWDEKRVVNRKKTDNVFLYDAWGRLLDWKDNGL